MFRHLKSSLRWPLLIALLLICVSLWQRQNIHDWLLLRNYQPSSAVIQLTNDIDVTAKGRKLFYVNHPAIDDRAAFNSACSNHDEQTIVLGCYHPVDKGIYVFSVTDSRLNGVEQVTAAHEMLHAAYDRLSTSKRVEVDTMLQDYYDHDLTDSRIKAIIAAYQRTEPHDVLNEMHSVFGTEVGTLPSGLQQYYQQYFTNRMKVVDYADVYEAEFTSRQTQVSADDKQLASLKQEITDREASIDAQQVSIKTLGSQMDSQQADGDIAAYNANVPVYNAEIDAYNALIVTTKSLITTYNQVVASRNQLALQFTDLAHAIDSSFQPISQ